MPIELWPKGAIDYVLDDASLPLVVHAAQQAIAARWQERHGYPVLHLSAREAYKAFARATGQLNGNLNTAKMLERFGREDDAIRYYEAARSIDPANTLALRRLTDLYQRVGRAADSDGARAALALALNNSPGNTGK